MLSADTKMLRHILLFLALLVQYIQPAHTSALLMSKYERQNYNTTMAKKLLFACASHCTMDLTCAEFHVMETGECIKRSDIGGAAISNAQRYLRVGWGTGKHIF